MYILDLLNCIYTGSSYIIQGSQEHQPSDYMLCVMMDAFESTWLFPFVAPVGPTPWCLLSLLANSDVAWPTALFHPCLSGPMSLDGSPDLRE